MTLTTIRYSILWNPFTKCTLPWGAHITQKPLHMNGIIMKPVAESRLAGWSVPHGGEGGVSFLDQSQSEAWQKLSNPGLYWFYFTLLCEKNLRRTLNQSHWKPISVATWSLALPALQAVSLGFCWKFSSVPRDNYLVSDKALC